MRSNSPRGLLLLAVPLLLLGCIGPGMLSDGSSVAMGNFNNGSLRRGRKLPEEGPGYTIPTLWRERGANYGTDEIVNAIMRAARRVAKEHPGGTLGVADIAIKGGGESKLHRSHENGHDADLIYYAIDDDGAPVMPVSAMPRYGAGLRSLNVRPTPGVQFEAFTARKFDVRRNWALVRALLEDPEIEVQFLFIHNRLRNVLLKHARDLRENEELIEHAEAILKQPGDTLPHDDHLHLRIYCSPTDRSLGCKDGGPLRWWRKRYKYMPPRPKHDSPPLLSKLMTTRTLR
ncbi:MAG TPA: penicillin-insensitive murein endopeptidase [Pseudomonadota bacterium]|nr:penicillin-insensitive murein endopeptidase [Pseudomonadota bacterium]